MMLLLQLALILNLSIEVQSEINLVYLRNETFNSSVTNSYFCCNVNYGAILSWEINGNGIGAFTTDSLEETLADVTLHYSYSASLLSLRSEGVNYIFDSVLVVSAPHGSTIRVNCVSDEGHNSISNLAVPMNNETNSRILLSSISMQTLFLTNSTIVSNGRNINTRAFMCSSNNTRDQSWEVYTADNSNDNLDFDTNSAIGLAHYRQSASRDTLRLQAISLGQHNQNFTSIIYLTDDTVVRVTCIAGGSRVEYPADFVKANTGMLVYYYSLV